MWIMAMVTLQVVYAAMAMAGIFPLLIGFCRRTMSEIGKIKARFIRNNKAAVA